MKGKLVVTGVYSMWSYGDVHLGGGVHELTDPADDLVDAVASGIEAQVLTLDEDATTDAIVTRIGKAVESAEDAMARQVELQLAADPEAWAAHHAGEADRLAQEAEEMPGSELAKYHAVKVADHVKIVEVACEEGGVDKAYLKQAKKSAERVQVAAQGGDA